MYLHVYTYLSRDFSSYRQCYDSGTIFGMDMGFFMAECPFCDCGCPYSKNPTIWALFSGFAIFGNSHIGIILWPLLESADKVHVLSACRKY